MNYPSLENYNEALQHPDLALVDPELKNGTVATTGLGLPLALCGGFALTYTVTTGSKKFAVRCFHKRSDALEKRYAQISTKLSSLHSPYFLDFEFQAKGVRANGGTFPIVKMAWARGDTLGQFVEANYQNGSRLEHLAESLRSLAEYLQGENLAHGDIQPGNVMVAAAGRSVQLIDYDGMFVEELRALGPAELGHRNFQHPGRAETAWDAKLDRFAFIAIDLALRALGDHPALWDRTQSDGDAFLFKANDFADPARSAIFADLLGRPTLSTDARNLAAICEAPFDLIPTLEDFRAGRGIPAATVQLSPKLAQAKAGYISAYPVLRATDYSSCLGYVGDRVELIGRIVGVKEGTARSGKPYIFINFAPWRGEGVKISIWSEGLDSLTQLPDRSWIGKWLSVVGLMEPPYRNPKLGYSHLSISVTQASQMHVITEPEAQLRLRSGATGPSRNSQVLGRMRPKEDTDSPNSRGGSSSSRNATILQTMKQARPSPSYLPPRRGQAAKKSQTSSRAPASRGPTTKQPRSGSPARPPGKASPTTPPPATGGSEGPGGCCLIVTLIVAVIVISSIAQAG